MRRLLLLFAGLLIGLTTVSATELNHQKSENNLDITKRYRYTQPIMFVERGIEFLIFPDGSFDFNTNTYDHSYYKKNSRRSSVNTSYDTRSKKYKYNNSYSYNKKTISISHDRNGKVRRIGNVYLNYDRYGKIKRAGSVYMNYDYKHGRLKQVGGLRIHYNHWGGIINKRGEVNRYNDYCNLCGVKSCTKNHSHKNRHHGDHDNDWGNNTYDNNHNYYYFKQNGKVKKHLKRK